jgi:DNA topoisomerase IB
MRLRRSNLSKPGITRRRRGRGVSYRDADGRPVRDAAALARFRALVIPPAWRDVWISPDPNGHIQATGVDAAGRKQYLYHPAWRASRDDVKFQHALAVAARLPTIRKRLRHDLAERGLTRARVLAAIVCLLDLGAFRIGGEQYANGDDPSYGLSTLRPEHVRGWRGCQLLEFAGKSGVEHATAVEDPAVCAVLKDLRRHRRGEQRLFAYWDRSARRWHETRADEINAYLREIGGEQITAKDFRTWHGTVRAATELAGAGPERSLSRRKRVVAAAMRDTAELLGNTPAVARASYVDPRVVDLYHDGVVAEADPDAPPAAAERAVRRLLADS